MQAHEIEVLIPDDHRLVVDLPPAVRSGPAKMILLVPTEEPATEPEAPRSARGRLAALDEELSQDPRSFRELSSEERRARLRRVKGIARGLLSTSEEFARQKREEVELEERKLAR